MSYFGGYFGLAPAAVAPPVTPPAPPISAAFAPEDVIAQTDHVAEALDRLCQQFRPES